MVLDCIILEGDHIGKLDRIVVSYLVAEIADHCRMPSHKRLKCQLLLVRLFESFRITQNTINDIAFDISSQY